MPRMFFMEQPILLFGDVQIYDRDLHTLEEGEWLNDTILEFYLEYLEIEYPNILFLRPGIAQFLAMSDDDIGVNFDQECIICPVNDNLTPLAGGTHWSLLVYYKGQFYHYDSFNSNHKAAAIYKKAIEKRINVEAKMVQVKVPIQNNSADCGVHVLATASLLAKQIPQTDIDEHALRNLVSGMRKFIAKLILEDVQVKYPEKCKLYKFYINSLV